MTSLVDVVNGMKPDGTTVPSSVWSAEPHVSPTQSHLCSTYVSIVTPMGVVISTVLKKSTCVFSDLSFRKHFPVASIPVAHTLIEVPVSVSEVLNLTLGAADGSGCIVIFPLSSILFRTALEHVFHDEHKHDGRGMLGVLRATIASQPVGMLENINSNPSHRSREGIVDVKSDIMVTMPLIWGT